MRKKQMVLWLVAALLIPALSFAEAMAYKGYLVDAMCGSAGKTMDKVDLTVAPQNHGAACMKACAAGGFGMMIQEKSGKYRFIRFDKKGDQLAGAAFAATQKKSDFAVTVTGVMAKDKIAVEKLDLASAEQEWTGYLSDVMCGLDGKSMDNQSDLTKNPELHSQNCALLCASSGFGLMLKDNGRYNLIRFDGNGNTLAKAALEKTKKKDHLQIKVKGVQNGEVINVVALEWTEK